MEATATPEGETDSKAAEGVASLGERGAGTPGRTQGKIFTEICFWAVKLGLFVKATHFKVWRAKVWKSCEQKFR